MRELTGFSSNSKGQMFLIAAVIIVASLVIIKFNMASPYAEKEQEVMEVTFENDIFENIINELNNTMIYSSKVPQNTTSSVFDFMNFTETKMIEHSLDLTILYVGVISNKTTGYLNVSLVNMLGSTMDANFTINTTTKESNATTGIVNYGRWNINFTITPGTRYGLDLLYNSTSGDPTTAKAESIDVKTKKNRDVYVGFFYISLASQNAMHTEKYQKTININ